MLPVRRFKDKHSPIDWGELVQKLVGQGYTYTEISEATGIGASTLKNIANDIQSANSDYDKAFALIELFLMVMDNGNNTINIPYIDTRRVA